MEDAIHRAADILRWLEQRQPAAIHELGSGRSTVVYAVWAARNGARHAAFEQDPVWCELTERAIELAGGNGHVILTPVEKTATAIRYLRAIPEDADFVYVDGPSGGGKHYATPDRTPVGLSIVDHVRSGNRPATIMIDGRASTCRALLSVLAARDYVISPQYHVAAEFGGSDDELNRHTVLTLRR